MTGDHAAETRLREEVASLSVADILALCYSIPHKLERLQLYMDVLRKQGGQRAQFASALICFDLARQGVGTYQHEFLYLSQTMREIAQDEELVASLIGDDPYLQFIWELCSAHLEEADTRFEDAPQLASGAVADTEDVASIDLLSDADFDDFGIQVDDSELWLRFDDAVEQFLGGRVGEARYEPTAGFRLKNSRDSQRVEAFLRELDSLRDLVPPARGFRCLVLLFYGTHLRSKSLFGTVNTRKQQLLREGLQEFRNSGPQMWEIAGVLNPTHASPRVWEKLADVIEDHLRWLAEDPTRIDKSLDEYDPIARLESRESERARRRG